MNLHDRKTIKAITFTPSSSEPSSAKVRVKPLEGQGVSTDLKIECPKNTRKRHPVGTTFKIDVKMCQREDGSYFLYNHHSWPMIAIK